VNEIPNTQAEDAQAQPSPKREAHLSKDGQWRSFPKVPHLLQYVSNGNYYARIKVKGKIIRESLKTGVWTTAKLRLILVRVQDETNDPRPSANAPDPVSICSQAGQTCFQSSHYTGHI
jgi:hypothetical protein